jgi:hypothetical protein
MKNLTTYLEQKKLKEITVHSIREDKGKPNLRRKIEQFGEPRVFNLFRQISLDPSLLK